MFDSKQALIASYLSRLNSPTIFSAVKNYVTQLMKDPNLIPDPVLAMEIQIVSKYLLL